jgi:hypothetical protein
VRPRCNTCSVHNLVEFFPRIWVQNKEGVCLSSSATKYSGTQKEAQYHAAFFLGASAITFATDVVNQLNGGACASTRRCDPVDVLCHCYLSANYSTLVHADRGDVLDVLAAYHAGRMRTTRLDREL